MKGLRTFTFLLVFISFVFPTNLLAQTEPAVSTYFDMSGFPQWARDLRRGEIIAFGAFPFAYFFANFGFDAYRFATNDWDRRYAPWPFNASPTIEKTQSEMFMTIGLAAGTAILISLVDHGIMRARRNRLARESINLPEGSTVIIRRSSDEENNVSSPETPEAVNP